MMSPMSERLARKTVKRYVCSNCWGDLEMFKSFDGAGWVVHCLTCKDETVGYVTRYYAERRQTASVFELHDAERILRKIGAIPQLERPAPRPGETRIQQNLRELGF